MPPQLFGGLFFLAAIAVAGLPPLSGFLGKLLILQSVSGWQALLLWPILLGGGLVVLVALSRAGSMVFWKVGQHQLDSAVSDGWRTVACAGLLSASLLLLLFASPLLAYTRATAEQLLNLSAYLALVGGAR